VGGGEEQGKEKKGQNRTWKPEKHIVLEVKEGRFLETQVNHMLSDKPDKE
jgi:hypothetical protein